MVRKLDAGGPSPTKLHNLSENWGVSGLHLERRS